MGVDIGHLWVQAGPFAKGVVICLALMSLFSLTVALTKYIQISKSNSATRKFAPNFSRLTAACSEFSPASRAAGNRSATSRRDRMYRVGCTKCTVCVVGCRGGSGALRAPYYFYCSITSFSFLPARSSIFAS